MGITKKYDRKLGRWLWGWDVRIEGKRVRVFQYTKRQDAEDALIALRIAVKERRFGIRTHGHQPTLAQLVEARIPTIKDHAEKVRSERVLKTLIECLPAGIRIGDITASHIRLFVDRRTAEEQAASSINRELNIIAATLHAAGSFFPELTQWVAPRMPRPKGSRRGRERLISQEEADSLIDYLRRPKGQGELPQAVEARLRIADVLQWALLTGMRHGEIQRLRWEHVDWTGGQLKVINRKNDSTRYLILTPTMIEILKHRQQLKEEFVFNQGGNTNPHFYRILRTACEKCGIPYGRKILNGLTLHDARHTATTRMLQAGVDLATIGSITGHKSRQLVLYYSHSTVESRTKAAEALEESAGKRVKKG